MLKNTYEDNENKKVNSREIKILKENFPQYFNKYGDFKIDEFKKMLEDDEVNFDKEGYRLDFLGKSYARFESALETETVITPDTKHNNEEINKDSENIYIVGDNIDALKHLLKSYSGKVKCIYIDPPYNTGSDGFVYPDNFKFDKDTLSNKMGVSEDEADRILSLQGKSTHSAWLTFMYPRLLLTRDLLTDEGVIFISIDDNEQSNLKILCDEIYGEENFIGILKWKKKKQPSYLSKIAIVTEYVLVYSKMEEKSPKLSIEKLSDNTKPIVNSSNKETVLKFKAGLLVKSNLEFIESGTYKNRTISTKFLNDVYIKGGRTLNDVNIRAKFRVNQKELDRMMDLDLIFITKNLGTRRYLTEEEKKKEKSITDLLTNWGQNQDATDETKYLFDLTDDYNYFDNPKPSLLIKNIADSSNFVNGYFLDFFSGSATTADSLMQLNSQDGGNRKYILVQIPEEIEKNQRAYRAGYKTIDEIGRERIKRAASKIKEETDTDIDYGFKLYRLNEPTVQTIDKLIDFDPNDINFNEDDYVSNFEFNGENGKDTILTTWLNEDGYGLLAQANPFKIGDYEAYKYKNSLYIINPGIKSSDIMELIKLLEKNQLDINRVVAYGYSLNFNIANELRNNLKNLKNNQSVSLIERY